LWCVWIWGWGIQFDVEGGIANEFVCLMMCLTATGIGFQNTLFSHDTATLVPGSCRQTALFRGGSSGILLDLGSGRRILREAGRVGRRGLGACGGMDGRLRRGRVADRVGAGKGMGGRGPGLLRRRLRLRLLLS
jgi:hypothetical protein